jgi:Tol biopolymer transport system component
VRIIIDFDDGYSMNKPLDTGWELQPSWSQANRLIAHLLYTIYDFTGTFNKDIIIDQLDTSLGGGIIQNDLSHPSWSPNGEKIACYGEDYIWIYDIKELVEKILDGIP